MRDKSTRLAKPEATINFPVSLQQSLRPTEFTARQRLPCLAVPPFSRNRPSALHPTPPSREHGLLPERLYTTRRDASQPPHPIGQNSDRPRGTTRTPTVFTATDSFNTQLEWHSSNQRRTVGDRQPPSPTTRHIRGPPEPKLQHTTIQANQATRPQPAPSTRPSHTQAMN